MVVIASSAESIRVNSRPSSAAAAVVPLPAKKSSTVSPGSEEARMIRKRMPSGFWVG